MRGSTPTGVEAPEFKNFYGYCYIVGLGLDCKFIDLLIKRSINIFIKISLYLNFIVLEIISKQTDTLI